MRIRTVLAFALLLPAVVDAQARRPRTGTRPGRPVPLSPQPEGIARSTAIMHSKLSIETYPLISRVIAPGFSAGPGATSWTSYGTGTRLDYRLTRFLSGTMDLTSSFYGGPALTETAELGLRLRPEHWDYRLRPFADARFGFEHASDNFSMMSSDLGIGPASGGGGSRYSRGFGGIVGAGFEYSLTNSFALTTAASAMRSNMTSYRYSGVSVPTGTDAFRMTTYRFTVGLKYNAVRSLRSSTNEQMPR